MGLGKGSTGVLQRPACQRPRQALRRPPAAGMLHLPSCDAAPAHRAACARSLRYSARARRCRCGGPPPAGRLPGLCARAASAPAPPASRRRRSAGVGSGSFPACIAAGVHQCGIHETGRSWPAPLPGGAQGGGLGAARAWAGPAQAGCVYARWRESARRTAGQGAESAPRPLRASGARGAQLLSDSSSVALAAPWRCWLLPERRMRGRCRACAAAPARDASAPRRCRAASSRRAPRSSPCTRARARLGALPCTDSLQACDAPQTGAQWGFCGRRAACWQRATRNTLSTARHEPN